MGKSADGIRVEVEQNEWTLILRRKTSHSASGTRIPQLYILPKRTRQCCTASVNQLVIKHADEIRCTTDRLSF